MYSIEMLFELTMAIVTLPTFVFTLGAIKMGWDGHWNQNNTLFYRE